MTAAGLHKPQPAASQAGLRPARAGLRIVRQHLASRRVPVALAALAVCGLVLRAALGWRWIPSTGTTSGQLPMLLAGAAASIIAVATYSPFGEQDRTTGRWLPWLRLGTAVVLAAAAVGALAAGAAGLHLYGGVLPVLRNVAGFTGIGLASAAVTGATLAWIAPMAYLVVADYALVNAWSAPWAFPARPPHDRGAAICAALVFAAGLVIITARGARPSSRD